MLKNGKNLCILDYLIKYLTDILIHSNDFKAWTKICILLTNINENCLNFLKKHYKVIFVLSFYCDFWNLYTYINYDDTNIITQNITSAHVLNVFLYLLYKIVQYCELCSLIIILSYGFIIVRRSIDKYAKEVWITCINIQSNPL